MSLMQQDKDADRALWARGSYARVADIVAPMAEDLVALAGITSGARVLDVAAGTGNGALVAARHGATVTASDLTPELVAIGMDRARSERLPVTWVVADAEDLPFADGSFDVVMSCIGVMFAPDHARATRELLRVCRPGGRIALANWTPDGYGGLFFGLLGRHSPRQEPTGEPPSAWGDPAHVRALFGTGVRDMTCTTRTFPLALDGDAEHLFELYRDCFGPLLRLRAGMADQPARLAALDDEMRLFLRQQHLTTVEFLAVIATRASA